MWAAVALVFAAQIAALFWFGNPPPTQRNHATAGPKMSLLTNRWDELLALQDPTIFALPHANNFSGAAWLRITNQEFQPTNPSEPPRPLPLSTEQLGATFTAFMQTNPAPRIQTVIATGLRLVDLGVDLPSMRSVVTASTVRVEGELAKRHLLEPLQLPPQASSDVLRNTEVQLFVDALGNTFSPVIVSRSGDDDVDALALTNFAKNAKFEPLQANARPGASSEAMTFGKLIFEWQTIPRAQTNAPPANP
jgi:hypothetical protein